MRPLLVGLAAAAVTAAVVELDRRDLLPGGGGRWLRTNHQGDLVTLVEGLALGVGATVPLLVADPPAALAVAGASVAGAVDDLAGGAATKGLRGHLSALRRGQVTTGVLKIGALGASGLLACAWSDLRAGRGLGLSTLTGGALVAGSANLLNLFDLRPGRALKVALASAVPLAVGRPAAAAVAGAGLVVLPDDLRGRSMLGDTGANPLGAAVGLAAAQSMGPRGRAAALAAVAGLVLLSERVSFSAVIDRTPVLRALDRWGRDR